MSLPSRFVQGVNGGGVTLAAPESEFQRHLLLIQYATNEKVNTSSFSLWNCSYLKVFTVTLYVKNSLRNEIDRWSDLCHFPVKYKQNNWVPMLSSTLIPTDGDSDQLHQASISESS